MSAVDAMEYWASESQPSDIFTVLCFDAPDTPISMDAVVDEMRARVRGVEDLHLRVLNVPGDLDRPRWVRSDIGPDTFVRHSVQTWRDCLDRVGELADGRLLNPVECPWRIHVFGPITGAPRGCADADGEAVVLVLQICHALADGRGIAAICLGLFGAAPQGVPARGIGPADRPTLVRWWLAAVGLVRLPVSAASAVWLGLRWLVELRRAARRGANEGAPLSVPLTALNRSPGPGRTLRVLALDRRWLPTGYSATAAALTAISLALDELLGRASQRTAVVPIGIPPRPDSHNNYHNLPIDLHPETDDVGERLARIARDLAATQQQAATPNPVVDAAARAHSASPAFLLRRAVRLRNTRTRPDMIAGVTVVTSVNAESDELPLTGGRPELALAGGRVRFAAGFPYLGEYMGLGHGVIGMGPAVMIAVITSPEIVDVDAYVDMLYRAVDRVAAEVPPGV